MENCRNQLSDAQKHALNIWLFSFYLAGMRVSDVLRLKWSDIQDGRLFYAMGKNNKAGSLKIPEKAMLILYQYQESKKGEMIFPELQDIDSYNLRAIYVAINWAISKFNRRLKSVAQKCEIEKPVTMHIARHSFGNISGEKIPLQMLQKLYRHTSITTTINYQSNFIFKDVDDALESVVG